MPDAAFELTMPARRLTGAVFASPHSGREYTPAFLRSAALSGRAIRSSEDAYVDRLWADVVAHGAPLLAARMPRAFLDLNRAADELDPALVEGVRRVSHNPRIASGLGVIPRVVAGGRPIYHSKMPISDAHRRIRQWWRPYHETLQRLLDESREAFGSALLIDCHSMPHEAIEPSGRGRRPDIVLGDRFGAAASGDRVEEIEAIFEQAGFRVARNAPFAGAYIVQAYGRPSHGQHAVQVEIDRSLYMDEAAVEPHSGFDELRSRLSGVAARIGAMEGGAAQAMAAE